MNEIMTTDQMDTRIDAVSALLVAAAPGLDIKVDEMTLPHCQPTAYVWVGELGGVCITGTGDDEATYAACDDLCIPYRTHATADEAVRELTRICAPAWSVAA